MNTITGNLQFPGFCNEVDCMFSSCYVQSTESQNPGNHQCLPFRGTVTTKMIEVRLRLF